MAIGRRDEYVQDAQGRALSGALVYYCTQPATTTIPPTPLASVFADIAGTIAITQPIVTDGFGHAVAYANNGILYTVIYTHPLFLTPIVLKDQAFSGIPSGGAAYTAFAEVPAGTIDGTNVFFALTFTPVAGSLILTRNRLPDTPGLQYTITGTTITYAGAPQIGDSLYAYYWH